MADSSVLLDALLQETEDEDELALSDAGIGSALLPRGDQSAADTTSEEDRGGASLVGLADLVNAQAAGGAQKERRPKKPSTRQRERQEILRLRAEEQALRKELARRQLQRQRQCRPEDPQDAASDARRRTSALWLRVARSQLERRQTAHVENLKLRHMLCHQVKVMQSMQKVLQKRSTASAEHWMSLRKRQCAQSDADAITFARLESDLDARYLETDAVLRASRCAESLAEKQHARVKIHATRGMYIEFFDAKILPFGFHDAGLAMWEGIQSTEISLSDGVYTTIGASAEDVSAKLLIRLDGARTEVLVDAKFVARKFIETDRVVIVWQTQTDTDGPLCGDRGVRLLNFGWTVIRDAAGSTASAHRSSDDAPSAIIQSVAHVMPELSDDPGLNPENVGVLADLVTTSYLRNMNAHHQRAEDILMERLTR